MTASKVMVYACQNIPAIYPVTSIYVYGYLLSFFTVYSALQYYKVQGIIYNRA